MSKKQLETLVFKTLFLATFLAFSSMTLAEQKKDSLVKLQSLLDRDFRIVSLDQGGNLIALQRNAEAYICAMDYTSEPRYFPQNMFKLHEFLCREIH